MIKLNKKAVKVGILEYAGKTRHHKFTRVEKSVYIWLQNRLEETIDELIAELIHEQPSKGKTIKA